jgi:hypothetical protein
MVRARFSHRSANNAGALITLAETALGGVAARQPGIQTGGADAFGAPARLATVRIGGTRITDLSAEDAHAIETVLEAALRVVSAHDSILAAEDAGAIDTIGVAALEMVYT